MESGRSKVGELYGRYGPVVYRRCLRLLHDKEGARDATQEVFMKLVRYIDRLEGREDVLPWIYRVATNHCLNQLRAARRHGTDEPVEAADLALAPASEDSYPARALARDLLARFDTGTQEVAVGVLIDGMEHQELATVLGISRKTVERRLGRFLAAARKILSGGSP